jgi:hypothetical protein
VCAVIDSRRGCAVLDFLSIICFRLTRLSTKVDICDDSKLLLRAIWQ